MTLKGVYVSSDASSLLAETTECMLSAFWFSIFKQVLCVCFKLRPCRTMKGFYVLFFSSDYFVCRVASLHAFRYTMADRDPVVAKGERGAPLFAHGCVYSTVNMS